MVFDRPKKTGSGKSAPATSRLNPSGSTGKPKKIITVGTNRGGSGSGGNSGHSGNGGGGRNGGNGDVPSPWLQHPSDPNPDPNLEASFVEYLRWMRVYNKDDPYRDATKVQILQMAEENANYRNRLKTLTDRTRLIAGEDNTFQAKCLWRIRVGGHRGPESILLPAFDALGMPYIPASTLRGVARTQAIRELMKKENISWKRAEEAISRQYFGYLDSKKSEERSGKVIFLDAYPLPQKSGNGGGLAVDMANNIWSWDAAGRDLRYSPNPNPFLSLDEATFLVGIRSTANGDAETLEKVKGWLTQGLQSGIGSQVNTGYGSLIRAGQTSARDEFFSVDFALEGQLIHGRQKLKNIRTPYIRSRKGDLRPDTEAQPEVRAIAFKSMLRYWFRAFALGFIPIPYVRQLEANLFGSIDSQVKARGWVKFRAFEHDYFKATDGEPAQQLGTVRLYPSEGMPSDEHKALIQALLSSLTWMAFRIGGIGQGARRPCYSRPNNPRWRGSAFIFNLDDPFWKNPETIQEFRVEFQKKLCVFHRVLVDLVSLGGLPCQVSEIGKPLTTLVVEPHFWMDAVDSTCQIFALNSSYEGQKPKALYLLHRRLHQLEEEAERLKEESRRLDDKSLFIKSKQILSEAKSLCGGTQKDFVQIRHQREERQAIPSPVWIADLDKYQVVTVFGATQNPRQQYVGELQRRENHNGYAQIWPLQ